MLLQLFQKIILLVPILMEEIKESHFIVSIITGPSKPDGNRGESAL